MRLHGLLQNAIKQRETAQCVAIVTISHEGLCDSGIESALWRPDSAVPLN